MTRIRHLLATAAFVSAVQQTAAAQTEHPSSRQEAVEVIREWCRILTPNGVERHETVRIGGIDQFVSIRGDDRRNPILLFIHGGPGFPTAPMAWFSTHGLEEYFTVVH